MPADKRLDAATALKTKGNAQFNAKNYPEAIRLYTQAIAFNPDPVFYSNRAACFANSGQYDNVVADCTEALKMDPQYVKALNRRAQAHEKKGMLQEALYDFTAVCIIDGFKNEAASTSMERLLKRVSEEKARELFKVCRSIVRSAFHCLLLERRLLNRHPPPSLSTPRARSRAFPLLPSSPPTLTPSVPVFSSPLTSTSPIPPPPFYPSRSHFPISPHPTDKDPIEEIADADSGDAHYFRARTLLKERRYDDAMDAYDRAVELGVTRTAKALNMRGTFTFLKGNPKDALEDFNKAIEADPNYLQTYIKRASIYMEQGDPVETYKQFDEAIKIDPTDPDIYYHRLIPPPMLLLIPYPPTPSVNFITGDFDNAAKDYAESIKLDPSFVYAHIQLGVAQYKMGSITSAMSTFKGALKQFPESADVNNYYGELLLDQQRLEDAMEKFEKAMELDPRNPLPYINKALLVFQFQQNMVLAEELCREALKGALRGARIGFREGCRRQLRRRDRDPRPADAAGSCSVVVRLSALFTCYIGGCLVSDLVCMHLCRQPIARTDRGRDRVVREDCGAGENGGRTVERRVVS
ncbi:hypothetical protein BC938DRAFT_478904 [Jimgerdemannia flammicorona]|uniref:Uncharacterized protein n=1 Tax=Jimgerdemannia flammicorona TaxID=994334 RepID=A0A433QM29_9FUNG|nr:hypothetical protein BC938DRAFT_478904 [Jimgerdemannia flammicorona]